MEKFIVPVHISEDKLRLKKKDIQQKFEFAATSNKHANFALAQPPKLVSGSFNFFCSFVSFAEFNFLQRLCSVSIIL